MKQRELDAISATPVPEEEQQAESNSPALGGMAHTLLQWQHTRGNQFVQEAVNQAREAAQNTPVVQPTLVLGAADDAYEREADRVARQVVSEQAALAAGPSGIQAMPGPQGSALAPEVQRAIQQARGVGQPLPQAVRSVMEQQLGTNLGEVSLHTDAQADHLNRVLGARAFTTGSDIFFRHGSYSPATQNGAELIAHELTHVAQQAGEGSLGQVQAMFWEKTTSPNQPYVWHDEDVDLSVFEDAGEPPRWYSENVLYGSLLGNQQYPVYRRRAAKAKTKAKAKPDASQKPITPLKQPTQQTPTAAPTKPSAQSPTPPKKSLKQPVKKTSPQVTPSTSPDPIPVLSNVPVVTEDLSFLQSSPKPDQTKKKTKNKTPGNKPALTKKSVPAPMPVVPPVSAKPKKVKLTPEQRLPEYVGRYQMLQAVLEDIQTQYLASDRAEAAQNEMIRQFYEWTTKRANLNVELRGNKERTPEYKAFQEAEAGPVGMSKPDVSSFDKFDAPQKTFDMAVAGTFSNLVAEERKIRTNRDIAEVLAQPEPDSADFNSVVSEYIAKEGYDRRMLFKALAVHGKIKALAPHPEDYYPQPTYNDKNAYGTEHVLQFSGRDDLDGLFVLHVHWSGGGRFEKAHFKKAGFGREFKTGHAGRDNIDAPTMKVLGLIDDDHYAIYPR